jgi:hypothetical protein
MARRWIYSRSLRDFMDGISPAPLPVHDPAGSRITGHSFFSSINGIFFSNQSCYIPVPFTSVATKMYQTSLQPHRSIK